MDETELIINSALLIAKDYLMDNNVFDDVIKLNKRKIAMINNDKINATGKVDNVKADDDDDDDLDIFFYKKYFLKTNTINNSQQISAEPEINENYQINNDYDDNNISIIELDDDKADDNITNITTPTPPQQLQVQCKRRRQESTVKLTNCPFEFFRNCDDCTFESQFKLTRKTFKVNKLL